MQIYTYLALNFHENGRWSTNCDRDDIRSVHYSVRDICLNDDAVDRLDIHIRIRTKFQIHL